MRGRLYALIITAGAAILVGCVTAPAHRALPDFAALVASSAPAVVSVIALKQPQAATTPVRGQGSGFIVSADGYILTGSHVVRDASMITVRLTDRREFPARVVGSDPMSDVAVLKIDATNLPAVRFGEPSALEPGQWVVAIGSPFGFPNSVSAGVVSGVERSLPDNNYIPFIQTDVAINPGNSGGPLFNLAGEVVGINSQVASNNGSYTGMSFAVPIDVARDVEQQLIETGHVVRSRIGVMIDELSAPVAQSLGLDGPRGALVITVEPGTPAAAAGIKPGDVILQLDASPIERYSQFSTLIARVKPDATTRLSLWRAGRPLEVSVRVRQVREPDSQRGLNQNASSADADTLGLSLRELTPEESDTQRTTCGLLVTSANGAAALAGIEAGDVIVTVNGAAVINTSEFRSALLKSRGVVALLIERKGQQIFVPIVETEPRI